MWEVLSRGDIKLREQQVALSTFCCVFLGMRRGRVARLSEAGARSDSLTTRTMLQNCREQRRISEVLPYPAPWIDLLTLPYDTGSYDYDV